MPPNRSIDEFVGADGESEDTGNHSDAVDNSDTGSNDETDDTDDTAAIDDTDDTAAIDDTDDTAAIDDSVEPAIPTAAWTAEDTCDRCGESTQRSWYEDGALVCAECKTW